MRDCKQANSSSNLFQNPSTSPLKFPSELCLEQCADELHHLLLTILLLDLDDARKPTTFRLSICLSICHLRGSHLRHALVDVQVACLDPNSGEEASSRKQTICTALRQGHCPAGDRCRFSHSQQERLHTMVGASTATQIRVLKSLLLALGLLL